MLRLRLVGDLGQVLFMPYDIRDEASLKKAMKHSNVVINLVGRDWETKNFSFDAVHVQGAARIAKMARECGVEKLIHVSSLNATEHPEVGIEHCNNADGMAQVVLQSKYNISIFSFLQPCVLPGGSKFLASKFHGEEAVRNEFPDAIIFRPADIYGQEDRFLR